MDCYRFSDKSKGGGMNRVIIISIIISLCIVSGFSNTIQELASSPYKLLAYYSELNEEQIQQLLEKKPFKRLFLVDFNNRKICALLLDNVELILYNVKTFHIVVDIETEKAVM